MDLQDYNNKKQAIHTASNAKLKDLAIKYAKSNNPVEEGDYVRDRSALIQVRIISYVPEQYGSPPECCYKGLRLTKQKVPFKDGSVACVLQTNILTHAKGKLK